MQKLSGELQNRIEKACHISIETFISVNLNRPAMQALKKHRIRRVRCFLVSGAMLRLMVLSGGAPCFFEWRFSDPVE
jgi:hypothetical protein